MEVLWIMKPAGVLVHFPSGVLTVEVSALYAVQIIDGSQCVIFFVMKLGNSVVLYLSVFISIEWYSFLAEPRSELHHGFLDD